MLTTESLASGHNMKDLNDTKLVSNIKNGINVDDSVTELITRHSGIYIDTVKKHIFQNNKFIDVQEILDEKDTFIYETAIKYNGKSKFSTYLCNRTWWMCKNLWKKKKNKLELPVETEVFDGIDIPEEIKHSDRREEQEKISLMMNLIEEIEDPNIVKILKTRYCPDGNTNAITSYSDISKNVGFSIEWCRKLHNQGIEILKRKAKKEVDFFFQ